MNAESRFQTFSKKDRDEILRLKELKSGKARTPSGRLKESLQTFRESVAGLATRPVRSGYAFNSPADLFASSIGFWARAEISHAIIDRLVEDDPGIQLSGLRLSGRLQYVCDLGKTAKCSGDCDCLHVFDLLLACATNDAALLHAYMARHPGPATSGHPFTVLICNAISALIKRNVAEYAGLIGRLRSMNESGYDLAMLECLLGIMESNPSEVRKALSDILNLHKRKAADKGAERYFCVSAHGLYTLAKDIFQETNCTVLLPPDVPMWDGQFQELVTSQKEWTGAFSEIESVSKPIANWVRLLPLSVGTDEFSSL